MRTITKVRAVPSLRTSPHPSHLTRPHVHSVRRKVIIISNCRLIPYWWEFLGVSWSRTRNSDLLVANPWVTPRRALSRLSYQDRQIVCELERRDRVIIKYVMQVTVYGAETLQTLKHTIHSSQAMNSISKSVIPSIQDLIGYLVSHSGYLIITWGTIKQARIICSAVIILYSSAHDHDCRRHSSALYSPGENQRCYCSETDDDGN